MNMKSMSCYAAAIVVAATFTARCGEQPDTERKISRAGSIPPDKWPAWVKKTNEIQLRCFDIPLGPNACDGDLINISGISDKTTVLQLKQDIIEKHKRGRVQTVGLIVPVLRCLFTTEPPLIELEDGDRIRQAMADHDRDDFYVVIYQTNK